MSEIATSSTGLVVGTAGHIDHGKTTLIRALTGIDTDRLGEEKRRGISIDLGFAHLALPNGRTISFVDVPGHERFVRNMLAGAAGIQAVMLIVAADESVMPQTREHFEICRLLGIRYGFVVLTKVDQASPEQLAIAADDVRELCAGSFLAGSPVLKVSSTQGTGLVQLIEHLTWLSGQIAPRESTGVARLPVDRSFSLAGFGTVVTGTLLSGRLKTGDTVALHPSKAHARVRGIQVHGAAVHEVQAGQRSAVNLAGIDSSAIARGEVLSCGDELATTSVVDVEVEWLPDQAVPSRKQQVFLHVGAAEIVAELKPMPSPAEKELQFARLWLAHPALLLSGDRFILRRPSPSETMGGGTVIDPAPPVRLNRRKTVERLTQLFRENHANRIRILVEEAPYGRTLAALVRFAGLTSAEVLQLVKADPKLLFHQPTQRVLGSNWLRERRARLLAWLEEFHQQHPSSPGAPIVSARLGLQPELAQVVFDGFPLIRVQGDLVASARHQPVVSEKDREALTKIENAFRNAGYQPPPMEEAIHAALADQKKGRALLESLLKSKRLVKVSENLIFHSDVIAHVRTALAAHKGRTFSVPEFKDWTQMSRKYAIPVLEYLDREKVTRRVGDQRLVV